MITNGFCTVSAAFTETPYCPSTRAKRLGHGPSVLREMFWSRAASTQ